MKKVLLITLILILNMPFTTVFASRSVDFGPKEYVITIHNIKKEDIKEIELLYGPVYSFNYIENNEWRYWLNSTEFGHLYTNYTDAQIIPTLTTEQIDEIAKTYISTDTSNIKGYWLNYSGFISKGNGSYILQNNSQGLSKFGINIEAKISYSENKIQIVYPGFRNSQLNRYSDDCILKITTKDEKIFYSEMIYSKMTTFYDEHSSKEERIKAEEVLDKTAYFEVDFNNIKNDFEVEEVNNAEEKKVVINENVENNIFRNNIIIILFLVLAIFIVIILMNRFFCKERQI